MVPDDAGVYACISCSCPFSSLWGRFLPRKSLSISIPNLLTTSSRAVTHHSISILKMHSSVFTAFALLATSSGAYAWGVLGHATVAEIANHYLTAQAKTYVSGLLGAGVSMPSMASWADEFRATTTGKFSAPYHFIDAEDNPPTSCSVDTARDCGAGGCVVSAIANYVSSSSQSLISQTISPN